MQVNSVSLNNSPSFGIKCKPENNVPSVEDTGIIKKLFKRFLVSRGKEQNYENKKS